MIMNFALMPVIIVYHHRADFREDKIIIYRNNGAARLPVGGIIFLVHEGFIPHIGKHPGFYTIAYAAIIRPRFYLQSVRMPRHHIDAAAQNIVIICVLPGMITVFDNTTIVNVYALSNGPPRQMMGK